MRVLITGARGFTARHLVDRLKQKCELYLTDLEPGVEGDWRQCDLTDFPSVSGLIAETRPDRIYNLAGSFSNSYEDDYRGNVLASKNIFDAVLREGIGCRVLLVGSAAEYGAVPPEDNPVKEDHQLNPVSVYGLTKAFQTQLMRYYHTVHGMDTVMARAFNLLGKGISKRLFAGRLFDQIERYRRGEISSISLGNLNNRRDYIDIGTAVERYMAVMERGESGEVYNVGSGGSIRIYDLLEAILKENNLDIGIVEEKAVEHNRFDIPDIYADITKIKKICEMS